MTKAELEELNSLVLSIIPKLDIANENIEEQMEYSKYLMSMLNSHIDYSEFVSKYKINLTFSEYKKQFLRERKINLLIEN